MRSYSGREATPLSLSSGCSLASSLTAVLLVSLVIVGAPASSSAFPLAEMARLSAGDRQSADQILALFRGYLSLGSREEAASYLERKVHLAQLDRETALPLFEEIVAEQRRWEEPGKMVEICETAIRNGARTPSILYSYGSALRQVGRFSDAGSILSRVPPESPWFVFALYALGQVAMDEGDPVAALERFRRVRAVASTDPTGFRLATRAVRSEAGLLLSLGRTEEVRSLLEGFRGEEDDPLVSVLRVAAGGENGAEEIGWPEEAVAGWPVRERILYRLFRAGLERDRGRYDQAIGHLARTEEEFEAIIGAKQPPASEQFARSEATDRLARQIEFHRNVRRILSDPVPGEDPESVRGRVVELLVDLLFLDHAIADAGGGMSPAPEDPHRTSSRIPPVFGKIEEVFLGGVEVDPLVEELGRKVDTLQNLAHPIERYRLMTRLEKSRDEIRGIKERVRTRREAVIAGITAGDRTGLSTLLTEVGKFLSVLEEIRASSEELRKFTRLHFRILRRMDEAEGPSGESLRVLVREALAFDDDRFAALLPSVKALEERARIEAWERRKRELLELRPIVSRQAVDVLVAKVRFLRGDANPERMPEEWTDISRAAEYLRGNRLESHDRIECAIHLGFLLAGGGRGRTTYPGGPPGDPEREMIATLIPLLRSGSESGGRREEACYLLAVLRIKTGDHRGWEGAREFLRKFPSSPFSGDLALRLGHEALRAGRLSEAAILYGNAAEGVDPEAAVIARYMLGWARFMSGDSRGATRELSAPLSIQSFPCGESDPFSQEILALSVRAWREIPLDSLGSYPPVMEGGCGGKRLLESLGEDERKRGESARAASVYDLLALRFGKSGSALSYEITSVEELIRAGETDQAFLRALNLGEKYGPGSDRGKGLSPSVGEKAREDLAALLKSLSEKMFDEGLRSGERSTMALAKKGLDRYFAVREKGLAGEDAELELKWAVASLKAGDRTSGIRILEGLVENNSGPVGERAGILHAETMIAGYERNEESADGIERSVLHLLRGFPSENSVSLARRAASMFLGAEQYERAFRIAEEVEKSSAVSKRDLLQARLIRAESSLFLQNLTDARNIAESILEEGSAEPGANAEAVGRARDLYLLASLKEVEARAANRDFSGSARILENLGERFPATPDSPSYMVRAMRLYRLGEDAEGAIRMGMSFLRKFPGRKEALEIAGTLGPILTERKEFPRAADLYATVAERFPKDDLAHEYLFLAARISEDHGDSEGARKRYSAYRSRYSNPRWRTAYATLSLGFLAANGGELRTAIREMEEGLRKADAGVEKDAPFEFHRLAGRARIAVGEYWAEQFRKVRLIVPLERNLAIKDRYFRRALALFDKARTQAPIEEAIDASRRSGDLHVEFGRAILDSQRPGDLRETEREEYEQALNDRARTFFARAQDGYARALDRLVAEQGPSDLAGSIRERIVETQRLLAEPVRGQEGR